MEPIRVLMPVRSLIMAILWTGIVVALAVVVITAQFWADPPAASATGAPTTGCTA